MGIVKRGRKTTLRIGRKAAILGVPIIALALGVLWLPWLPDQLDMHWGADGRVTLRASTAVALLIVPAIGALLGLGLLALGHRWCSRFEGNSFQLFERSLVGLQCALLIVHLAVLALNAGFAIQPEMIGSLVAAMAFFGAGLLMRDADRNPLLGVRTRHTLADATVWEATNRRVSLWLRLAAFVCLLGVIRPGWALYVILGSALLIAVDAHFYAARLYRERHPDDG